MVLAGKGFVAMRAAFASVALKGAFAFGALVGAIGAAQAEAGHATPGQFGFQTPVTKLARDIQWFHNDLLLPIIAVITAFVAFLLAYVIFRFNAKSNPVPSAVTHNTGLEVAWTLIPILILIGISIPSFRLLKEQVVIPPSDLTVKATGKQWYWSYEYPKDQGGGFGFDSLIKLENELDASKGDLRLLSVDNEMVVPIGKVVRVQITGADVLHSFMVPSLGIRMDAVPGRLNETWFKAEREGVFYGQCSLICGKDHAFMPIAVRVVSEARYAAWLVESKKKFAQGDGVRFAAALP